MKWFKHDSDAHTDAKLKKVRHKYGITGYGLYWYCVELIAGGVSPKSITFELEEDAEIIALEWGLDQLKVQEIIEYMVNIGLFDLAQNNRIRCIKLAYRLDDTNSKNPQIRSIIKRLEDKNTPSNSEEVGETPSNSESVGESPARLDKIRIYKNTMCESGDSHDSKPPPKPKPKKPKSIGGKYSELFERFWKDMLGIYKATGSKVGAKDKASKEFEKYKPDDLVVDCWLKSAKAQKSAKLDEIETEGFTPNFTHVERWLKDRRFNDLSESQSDEPKFNEDLAFLKYEEQHGNL